MQATELVELKKPLAIRELPDPHPNRGWAVLELKGAALNRRDYWICQGMYPGIVLPTTLGSDGAGLLQAVELQPGNSLSVELEQGELIINPGWNWGTNEEVQGDEFHILGMPARGTFAEKIAVPLEYLHPKPKHLNFVQAAALPLAGVTAFRALFSRGRLTAGEKVLVTGVGGGVASLAVQFAHAAGAEVFVTSSSDTKIEQAIQLGARAGFRYDDPAKPIDADAAAKTDRPNNWTKQLLQAFGTVDLVIDGAGGTSWGRLGDVCRPGGRIVNYGVTAGNPNQVDLFKVFWKQLNLLGSTMGSNADFAQMLQFVSRHQIVPVIDRQFHWQDVNLAMAEMERSSQFGKLVLTF